VDVAPKKKTTPQQRIAQLLRLLGSSNVGERRIAWTKLEHILPKEGFDWNDIGDAFVGGDDDGKYTEAEMQEFASAARAEGVEEGIKIGRAHAGNGSSNGHLTLPLPLEMAEYCHDRPYQLKDDKQRDFVVDMYVKTQRGWRLKPGQLGYLASIYIQIGGKVG
jgi:hypothetical protein